MANYNKRYSSLISMFSLVTTLLESHSRSQSSNRSTAFENTSSYIATIEDKFGCSFDHSSLRRHILFTGSVTCFYKMEEEPGIDA